VDRLTKESEIISTIMIVDDDSRIVAANDLNRVGMIADDKGIRSIINGAEIYTRLYTNQKIYMVDMPLRFGDEFQGVISIGYDATNYYTHLAEIFKFGLLISAMGILMGILLSFQVSNPIIKPIQRLTEVTKRLAGGDLSQRASVSSRDEVGTLARAFNQMAHDLARSKEELDQYSKTLEQKVRLRTQELERSNQDLRVIQNELMEADMAKSEFLSIASHELRTPLTTLLGYSELLLTRRLSLNQQREFLGFINEESIRLSRIVDDLLDISRIESQKDFGFAKKPFSLGQVLTKNIKFFTSGGSRRVVTNIEKDLPLASGDAEKTGQVVKNLIDNAMKYSPRGDIVCRAFAKDNMAWINVQDHGIGISSEDLPRIFDKFFRVEREETEHVSGTGLGLSIVKYIVESQGGRIDVQSELGKGTTIGFGLPIHKD
jgi:signal transduction histidine kinase